MRLNEDVGNGNLAQRVRELEHALDVALAGLETSATQREREAARETIRRALRVRRSLPHGKT